jgi:hypothetical protein
VQLRNKFKFHSTDLLRLTCFRRETIEQAILLQDIIDAQGRGDRKIRSIFLKERDQAKMSQKVLTMLSKKPKSDYLVYFWYVYIKPLLTFILGLIFTSLSLIILYAEVANFFGAQDNIIYNIVTAPQISATSSYFLSHVIIHSFLF